MTPQEAKKYVNDCGLNIEEPKHSEVLVVINEALDKQIPKKVEEQRWIYTKCACGYEFSKHHGDGYYSIPYQRMTKYCPECGQKLDWKEKTP